MARNQPATHPGTWFPLDLTDFYWYIIFSTKNQSNLLYILQCLTTFQRNRGNRAKGPYPAGHPSCKLESSDRTVFFPLTSIFSTKTQLNFSYIIQCLTTLQGNRGNRAKGPYPAGHPSCKLESPDRTVFFFEMYYPYPEEPGKRGKGPVPSRLPLPWTGIPWLIFKLIWKIFTFIKGAQSIFLPLF